MTDRTPKPPRRRPPVTSSQAPAPERAVATQADQPSAADPAGPESKDETMATTFEQTTDAARDQAESATHAFAQRTQGAMDKGKEMVEEMSTFAKGNVEAMVESTGIYARGLETLSQDATAFAKKSYEDAAAAMKAMAAAKSPTELFKLHSDYTRQMFDAMVAETSKSTERMVKLVGEVAQPLSTRVSLATDKAKLGG